MLAAMLDKMRPHHFAAGLVGIVLAAWWLHGERGVSFSVRFWAALFAALAFGFAIEGAIRLLPIVRALLRGERTH
jgi:hypothetical protein